MTNRDNRIIGFDIARAVSIIWVVMYHSLDYSNLWYHHSAVKTLTYASLAIFTFLSGYLLASRYDFEGKDCLKLFYRKRFVRFYPLFFISSLLLCLIGFNTWFNTVKGLVGISPFWMPHPRTMWYCAMLIFLYFITPFWSKGGLWRQISKFAFTMVIIAGIHLVFQSVEPRTFFYFPFYFAGIIIAQYGYDRYMGILKSKSNVVVSIILFLIILGWQIVTNNSLLKWSNSILGMYAFMSLYVFGGEQLKNKKFFISVISLLSYASLCIYLFHREVDEVLLKICHPDNPYVMFCYVGILGLMITIPQAYYIQKGYDTIIHKMKI